MIYLCYFETVFLFFFIFAVHSVFTYSTVLKRIIPYRFAGPATTEIRENQSIS